MWQLRVACDPLPILFFEIPGTVDGEAGSSHSVNFRFINPRVIFGIGIHDIGSSKTVELAYEMSKSLESASTQTHFPFIGVPLKGELFGISFDAFRGQFKGTLDILQDIAYHYEKKYDVIYPEGREKGVKYRGHEPNRILPLYLLHEYIIRLPPTLLIASRICMADIFEMTIEFLRRNENEDTDEGLAYLFNRLMLERSQRNYYRFLEKHYDSTSVIANVLNRLTATIDNQRREILKMQTQIEILTKSFPPVDNAGICKSIMSLE